jgi:hypothetical protein
VKAAEGVGALDDAVFADLDVRGKRVGRVHSLLFYRYHLGCAFS